MDFFAKLKITFKGPNSLGNSNENNIAAKYRGIDPSYIGKIDINVCGTSDPGTSAVLTPFCKTDGLYFDGARDPEDFMYKYDKDITDTLTEKGAITVSPSFKNVEDYFNYHLHTNEVNESFKVCTVEDPNDFYIIDIVTDDD